MLTQIKVRDGRRLDEYLFFPAGNEQPQQADTAPYRKRARLGIHRHDLAGSRPILSTEPSTTTLSICAKPIELKFVLLFAK